MGFYYGPSTPPGKDNKPSKEPGGCLEALLLTRAAFGALAAPLVILFGSVIGIALVLYLFAVHILLGLVGVAVLVLGVALYARWERDKFISGPPP